MLVFISKCFFRQYTVYPVSLPNIKSKFMHSVMLKVFMCETWKFMPKRSLKGHTGLTNNTIQAGLKTRSTRLEFRTC